MDIRMELLQEPYAPDPSLVALFSFVHLDPVTKRPAKVPPLLPQTAQEQQWAAERSAVAAERKAARQAGKEQDPWTRKNKQKKQLGQPVIF
jgi:acyl-coenzyme A thioesterase 9